MILLTTKAGLVELPPGLQVEPTDFNFSAFLPAPADAGTLDLIFVTHPQAPWPSRHLRLTTRPTLVVVSDDPGGAEGAAQDVKHYALAVEGAEHCAARRHVL